MAEFAVGLVFKIEAASHQALDRYNSSSKWKEGC